MHIIGIGRLGANVAASIDESVDAECTCVDFYSRGITHTFGDLGIADPEWHRERSRQQDRALPLRAASGDFDSPGRRRLDAENLRDKGQFDFLNPPTEFLSGRIEIEQDELVVVAGMGGCVGSGVAPVVAGYAKDSREMLTVAVVTKPFQFEGKRRKKQAEEGIAELEQAADAVVAIENEYLFKMTDRLVTIEEAFFLAHQMLGGVTQSVAEIMNYKPPRGAKRRKSPIKRPYGLPELLDAHALMRGAGAARAAIGYGRGETAAQDAAAALVASPLLDPVQDIGQLALGLTYGSEVEQDDLIAASQIVRNSVDSCLDILIAPIPRATMGADEVRAGLLVIGDKPDSSEQLTIC